MKIQLLDLPLDLLNDIVSHLNPTELIKLGKFRKKE